jgi:short-chain fatty acids transporter
VLHFRSGGALDINMINFVVLFAGLILMGTPRLYVERFSEGVSTAGGMILQYPFYAGILAIMGTSGLVATFSRSLVSVATAATLPFWGLISSFLINFFVPGAGGHWVLQGPVMVDAAKSLHASMAHTATAVMLGNAWNDLIQPFWLLPALALSKLKLKDVMGYTFIAMAWVGIVFASSIYLWR